VFHRFGRLAQISLKSAYGFVQYHTIAEGTAAMQGAQGIELGGRRIRKSVTVGRLAPPSNNQQTLRYRAPKKRRTKGKSLRTAGARGALTVMSGLTVWIAVGNGMTIGRYARPRRAGLMPAAAETAIILGSVSSATMRAAALGRPNASTAMVTTLTDAGAPAPTAGPHPTAVIDSTCRAASGLTFPTSKSFYSRKSRGISSAGCKAPSIPRD
jgi:RNA recognition motif-containing protein